MTEPTTTAAGITPGRPAQAATCLIPGCNGSWHDENICDTILADTATPAGASLIAEVEASPDLPTTLVVWEGEDGRDLLRTSDQAEARDFADRLRTFAAAVDKGAALLAPAAVIEPVDYAARFAALDADVLFDLEGDTEDCTAASAYVESLLIVLAEWRPRVVAMLADAPEWAVPEAAAYRGALDRPREALVQWEFRHEGGPDLPWPFDLPQPASKGAAVGHPAVARIVSAGRRDLIVRGVAA